MGDRVVVRREAGRLIVRRAASPVIARGLAWTLALLWLIQALLLTIHSRAHPLALATLAALGLAYALGVLSYRASAWRVEAGLDVLALVREGLFGERRRAWPARDVAAVWLEEHRGEDGSSWECRLGLRDGSHRALLFGDEEGMRRLVDLLRERPRETLRAIGICRVCGAGMSRRIVTCARCRTPHHAECWTYAGQCSTYGCREIQVLTLEPDSDVST